MRRLTLILGIALILAACGIGSSDIESSWLLESGTFDGQPMTMLESHPITMDLSNGELEGTAACNRFFGTYRVDDETFSVTAFAMTEMACVPSEAMTSETEFNTALFNVDAAEVVDDSLVMTGSRSELIFVEPGVVATVANQSDTVEPAAVRPFGAATRGSWELVSGFADGQPIPTVDSHPITLTIGPDAIGGTAACNSYFFAGSLPVGDGLSFGVTEMACLPAEVMESETAFLGALARIQETAVANDLVLLGDGVELTFRALEPVPAADLLGTVWVLDALIQGDTVSSPVSGERATLELFSDGSFIGFTGCRTISGSYVVSGAEIVLTTWGTDGVCPPEFENQDVRVVSSLEGRFRVEIEGDRLTTWVSGDEGLIYRADS